jgi:thiopurine S-methyltransferase
MEASFWHQKWEKGDIGFHESEANPLLTEHFEKLNLEKGSRIFLPLCGKTRDFAWLLSCGYRVVGAELSELAISRLFNDLGIEPKISRVGELVHYGGLNIDIFVGDIFDVSAEVLGAVDAIYDRAALVALDANTRNPYISHLMKITGAAPQLLIVCEYDQSLMDGPPFSINQDEVEKHYEAAYYLNPVERKHVIGGLKGKVAAIETVWLLQKSK